MSDFKKYQCTVCDHIYDEAMGDPDSGIEPGTFWVDIPEEWACPECGATKEDFKLMQ
jgi:rubredoxin